MKIMVINGSSYAKPFRFMDLPFTFDPNELISNPTGIGLVVFTGGEDVTPAIYGDEKHPSTYNNVNRDAMEMAAWKLSRRHNIPSVGICRGAQFLCAMAGGLLVQDITGHAGPDHQLRFKDENGNVRTSPGNVTSSHHQMQYPFNLNPNDYELVAWSSEQRSRHYAFGSKTVMAQDADANLALEPDVVWYKKINALGIQYHPEWMSEESWGFKFAQSCIRKYICPLVDKRIGVLHNV